MTPLDTLAPDHMVLTGTGGSQAQGLMRLVRRDGGAVPFAIAGQNVPPDQGREVYAVWFTREGGRPRREGTLPAGAP
jgi:hypothetical protein